MKLLHRNSLDTEWGVCRREIVRVEEALQPSFLADTVRTELGAQDILFLRARKCLLQELAIDRIYMISGVSDTRWTRVGYDLVLVSRRFHKMHI